MVIKETLVQSRWPAWLTPRWRGRLAGHVAFWGAAAVLVFFTALALLPEAVAPYNPRAGAWPIAIRRQAMWTSPVAYTGWEQITRDAMC